MAVLQQITVRFVIIYDYAIYKIFSNYANSKIYTS